MIRNNKNLNATAIPPFCGGNMASGGGLAMWTDPLVVSKSTVAGNHACRGGGIAAYPGSTLRVENSTLSGNKANLTGDGLFLWEKVNANTFFNTITQNQAGTAPTGESGFWDEKYGGGIAFTSWSGYLNMSGNVLAQNQTVFSDKSTLFHHGHDCFDKFGTAICANRHAKSGTKFIGALANCSMLGSDASSFIGWEGLRKILSCIS